MDFLKAIFGDKALTYAELEAALKDSKDIKLANLAAGGYVDKGKYEALETRNKTMAEQLKGLESVKPEELQAQIAAIKKDKAWAFPSKEKKTPELSGAVPAEPSGGNTEQTADIAMMNSLLGLPN